MVHDLRVLLRLAQGRKEQPSGAIFDSRTLQSSPEVTGDAVDVAFVDQGYTGDEAVQAAAEHGLRLEVVKLLDAKRGFVLLPRRWVVERSFGWMSRFRRLLRDYERLPETLKGLHFLALALIMPHRFVQTIAFCL